MRVGTGGGWRHAGRRPQQGIIYTKYSELNCTAKRWRPLQRDEEVFKWQSETVTPGLQRERVEGGANTGSGASRKSINPKSLSLFSFLKSSSQSVTVHLRPRLISYGRGPRLKHFTWSGGLVPRKEHRFDDVANAAANQWRRTAFGFYSPANAPAGLGPVRFHDGGRGLVRQGARAVCKNHHHNFVAFMVCK